MLTVLLPAILVLFCLIFFVFVFGTMIRASLIGAPWVPTFKKNLLNSLTLAQIKPGETVYDLGCGDGRWLTAAAKLTPAKKIIGVEISLLPYFLAKVRRLLSPERQRLEVFYQNFYQFDLNPADVIYIFSLPKVMAKLEPKLARELKPGARLVSLAFKLPHKEAEKVLQAEPKAMPLYLYRF